MSFCGDGVLDPGELCDLGAANADRPALQVSQGGLRFAAYPHDKPQSAVSFYAYFSSSAHTGFEAPSKSELFFYRNTGNGVLSLFTIHGIDQSTTGQAQPQGHVIMDFAGLPSTSAIALRDDLGEINGVGATGAHGDWNFQNNTDGAVFAGLTFPGSWSITITPQFLMGIDGWTWVHEDGSLVPFDLTTPVVLTAFNTPSMCRTNCTVPTCGDGILDGGEVCDDGNNAGGDGCAADCKSLQ